MKRIKLILLSIVFAGCLLILENKSYAASASISASSTSVTPGTSVTVSASVSATETYNLRMTASGGNLTGNINNADAFGTEKSQGVLSGTFSASTPGTYTITLSGTVAGSDLSKKISVYDSISIVVKQNSNENNNTSNNNNSGNTGTTVTAPTLSNLGIKPNDFSGFSPSKTSYTVNVPNDCTTVNLYATSKNGTVSGTGNKTLKEGTNKFAVTVTNSAGSKTYYVSVVRKTAEGTEPPNVIDENTHDETENQEKQDGIGLSTLEIPGYKLDKEFKSDVYTYTITVDKQLTETELEALKEKIVATANVENVQVEVTTNISEDGVASITILVKDTEKEYAKYVVTFEVKKEDTKVAGIVKNNSNTPTSGMFGLTGEQQIYAILGGIGISTFLAIVFACVSYAKSRRIAEFEDDKYKEEDSDFDKMNQYYVGIENNNSDESVKDRSEEITNEPSIVNEIEDTATSLRKANGYRRLARGRRSYGKH